MGQAKVIPYQASTDHTSKRKKLVGTWLRTFAETKKRPANHVLTKETCEAYEISLKDIPIDDLAIGFERASREYDWFPSDTEVRKVCPGMNSVTRAEQAWELVQRVSQKK